MVVVSQVLGFSVVVLGFVLAFRLLRMAARTRSVPELAMGIYCLLVSIGTFLFAMTLSQMEAGSAAAAPLSAAYMLFVCLGAFALAIGIWRIFRPAEPWARVLVVGIGVWFAGSYLAQLPGLPVLPTHATPANAAFLGGRALVYAWGAFEAFRYAAQLRRRVAIGLADPVTAHQIQLWGCAWSCVTVIAAGPITVAALGGEAWLATAEFLIVLATINAAAWICTWLSFFPPRAYQRWIAGAPLGAEA